MTVPQLLSPLAVVCHDAGATNVILPWLAGRGIALRPVMQGPARALFEARFPGHAVFSSLDEALDGAAMLLTGTGWASTLEHDARRLARARGLRSAAVIDHWVNYAMRFERGGQVVWPDEFWVTDAEAQAIAERTFAGARVRRFDNLYLEAQVARVGPPRATANGVLYLLEPMRSDWGRGDGLPGEFQALDFFLAHRAEGGLTGDAPVRLRPHPSDAAGKYDAWIARQRAEGVDVRLDRHAELAEAIGAARWVAGCESFALVVALMAGREVIGTLPPWAPACRLPQAGVRHLRDAVSTLAAA